MLHVQVYKQKKIDEAEKLVIGALALDPNNAAFLDSLGWVYYRQGKIKLALKKILHAVNQLPNDAVILDHLGDIYLALKEIPKALIQWKKSYKIDPKGKKVHQKILKYGERVKALPKKK